jgi:hypothetical protein
VCSVKELQRESLVQHAVSLVHSASAGLGVCAWIAPVVGLGVQHIISTSKDQVSMMCYLTGYIYRSEETKPPALSVAAR